MNSYFNPTPNSFYKIVSVQDGTKAFTINQSTQNLALEDFKNTQFQRFNIYMANGTYSFVTKTNMGLFISGNTPNDGSKLQVSPNPNASSYFGILPITNGVWAGKACYIRTAYNKTLQNAYGDVIQSVFNDKPTQIWAIIPCDEQNNNQGFNNGNQGLNNNQNQGINNNQGFNNNQGANNPNSNITNNNSYIIGEVPNAFVPIAGKQYKILNIQQPHKCWSVEKNTKFLNYAVYTGDASQKFVILQNGSKFAFVDQFTNTGLYVENNSHNQGAKIKADPTQHPSSWFEICKTSHGKYAKNSYMFKTHSGKFFDIHGGIAGTFLNQWGVNYLENQTFLIVPVDQEVQNQQNQNQNQGFNPQTAQQVPVTFTPVNGVKYKIINAQVPTKAWTIDNQKNLSIANYTGQATQKFVLYQNGTKFAFVDQLTNTGLYIENNRMDNGAKLKPDPAQHQSSWFQIVRTPTGKYANTSYVFKTFANKAVDVAGGLTGTYLHQWDLNSTAAQTFLIVPADEVNGIGGLGAKIQGFGTKINNVANIVKGWGI